MFLLFWCIQKKTNPIGWHKGRVFAFLGFQKSKSNRREQGLCFCFFGASKKNKSNRRAQGLSFCLFVAAKKAIPIGGQKGVVFVFFFLGLLKKTNPIGWHKGCVFCFCGASKKNNRRAQGLCFCFLGGFQKKQMH